MKKQLLHISAEAAELIRKYHEVENSDDSLYFDSDLKRKRLLAAAEHMVKSIAMVSPDNPSFKESGLEGKYKVDTNIPKQHAISVGSTGN